MERRKTPVFRRLWRRGDPKPLRPFIFGPLSPGLDPGHDDVSDSSQPHYASGALARFASSAEDCRDVARELLWLGAWRVAVRDSKLPVDQELGEIPLDRLRAQEAGRVLFERLKQRMGVRAVDLDLCEHRERHVVLVGAKLADYSLVVRPLMAKLVARKSEHSKAALTKTPVQRFEARVLRGEAALARNIND
jgi:hypothetical protein